MCAPIVTLLSSFASLIGLGGSPIMAMRMGAGDEREAQKILNNSFFMLLVTSVLLTFGFLAQKEKFLMWFGASQATFPYANTYVTIYTMGTVFALLSTGMNSFLIAQGFSGLGMVTVMLGAVLNIILDPIFIFGFHMGVEGAAISTLISRIFCAVVVLWKLRDESKPIFVKQYLSIRPDFGLIKKILFIGIPSGIENSMFQFGKLAIQSTVSTLGTVAIAAQAMTNILENLNGVAAIGVGIGLMTVVGQCLGAGRKDEAIYYIKKLCWLSEVVIVASCLLVFVLTKPITMIGGMEAESAKLCMQMMIFITIVKPLCWVMAFVPGYGMRAAGDVNFSMITSCCTMWLCRVSLCIYLCRVWGFGPIAVWIGMAADWSLRSILFTIRFKSGKWLNHHLIEEKKQES